MKRWQVSILIACMISLAMECAVEAQDSADKSGKPPATAGATSLPGSGSPLARAEQLYRTGKLDEAALAYTSLIQAEPNSVLSYVGLVRVYLKQKKPAEAYAAATKAAEMAPMLDVVRVAMGDVYFRQGKMAEAEKEFASLINKGTGEPRAYLGLSRVYHAGSYYQHAKMMIDKAHALDPADPDIQRAWMATLPAAEWLKSLLAYLAVENNDDTEQRRSLVAQLAVLNDETGQSARPWRLAKKVRAMEIPLERLLHDSNHLRGYGLRVNINSTSYKLMLDSGASGIIVDRKIADKAGIKPITEVDLKGIGDKGAVDGYVGYAESIKIGDLEFSDCYVRVMDKRSVAGEDGLIGADVFSDFLVDIDFPHARFRLSELPPRPDETTPVSAPGSQGSGSSGFHDRYIAPEMKGFTPVFRFGHQLLIPTKINDLPPKLFLIDTGAFSNTVNPAAAREVTKVSSDSQLIVKGISGTVKEVFRANELTLQFSHLRQRNLDIVALDTSHISDSVGTEVSGMLGFSMLWMLEIKIDYRDGLVDFYYDPNRAH